MQEYLFLKDDIVDLPLDESIKTVDSLENLSLDFLISNVKTSRAYFYAPELNYYIKNSDDSLNQKIKNVKKLYDIRAEITNFIDDEELTQQVGKKVLFVNFQEENEVVEKLIELDFNVTSLGMSNILDVKGHIGDFKVTVFDGEENSELTFDQIVWENMPDFSMKKNGIYDLSKIEIDKCTDSLSDNLEGITYKKFLNYNVDICQYHGRRSEICTDCVKVCPTDTIINIDKTKHLEFSHIDCVGCGKCVSVCPSGALDLVQMPLESFSNISVFYQDSIVLLMPKKVHFETLDLQLPQNVLPLVIESKESLTEAHLITLLQSSGNSLFFYTKSLSGASLEAVELINEIFSRKYNKKAIYLVKNQDELNEAYENMESLSECRYSINQINMNKKEVFSARLAHLVGSENLGTITTGEKVHYGTIKVNQDKCTLCFSCIGACNMKALVAQPKDNSLRFNPSLCTSCGYCLDNCPEDCITIIENELSLEPNYFVQNIMAKDELFKCSECGKEFATVKSVQKIASVMAPYFQNDPLKMATLYCCAECKPKVMFNSASKRGF